jgi:hypothetical protein
MNGAFEERVGVPRKSLKGNKCKDFSDLPICERASKKVKTGSFLKNKQENKHENFMNPKSRNFAELRLYSLSDYFKNPDHKIHATYRLIDCEFYTILICSQTLTRF